MQTQMMNGGGDAGEGARGQDKAVESGEDSGHQDSTCSSSRRWYYSASIKCHGKFRPKINSLFFLCFS